MADINVDKLKKDLIEGRWDPKREPLAEAIFSLTASCDPILLFGYLDRYMVDARISSGRGSCMVDVPEKEAQALHDRYRRVLTASEQLLADETASIAAAERRALQRVMLVGAANADLEQEPDAATLARAAADLDRYKAMREQPNEPWEMQYGRHRCELDYVRARGRQRAWEALISRDYGFVADFIEQDDLDWSMDPLFVSGDFQAWAETQLEHIGDRKADFHYGPSSSYSYAATVPDDQMAQLVRGRLLAALLAGVDPLSTAGDLFRNRVPETPQLMQLLLRAGLDPNAEDKDSGDRLLHDAAKLGNAQTIEVLLAAGACREHRNKAGKTALDLARTAAARRVLSGEAVSKATTTGKTRANRTVDLRPLRAALGKYSPSSLRFWSSCFAQKPAALSATLDQIEQAGCESWQEAMDGPLLRESPWQHLVFAGLLAKTSASEQPVGPPAKEPRLIVGNLKMTRPLLLEAPLVVCGNLTVNGAIIDTDPGGWLAVHGDLQATALVSENDVLVGGQAALSDFVWGDYNDHQLLIGGALNTPLLLLTDHAAEIGDTSNVTATFENPDDTTLRELFLPELIDGEGCLLRSAMVEMLLEKRSVVQRT
jgi:hypothetical protein